MSRFTREEQTNIVGMAAELETAIIAENEELRRLNAQQFKVLPQPPVESAVPVPKYLKATEPPVKAMAFSEWAIKKTGVLGFLFKKNYLWISLLIIVLPIVGFILSYILGSFASKIMGTISLIILGGSLLISAAALVFLVVMFLCWPKKQLENEVRNSPEYQARKDEMIRLTNAKNQELKLKYEAQVEANKAEYLAAKDNYDTVIIPAYKNELAVWTDKHNTMIDLVQNDLKQNQDALDHLYSTTQLIPVSYHNSERLVWLYEDMSSSEHDIERAIDLLNNKEIKEELVNIQGSVNSMRRDIQEGFIGVYNAIQDGNDIQSDMLENLEEIRSSAKTGNYLSIGNLIQGHKRNKILEQRSKL